MVEQPSRAVPGIARAGAEMSIWHLFSAIAFIAAVASAVNVAKTQHTSLGSFALCIVLGVVVGVLTGIGSFACAKAVQRKMDAKGSSLKITVLLLLGVLSIAWIVIADRSGHWVAAAALHAFASR